MKTNQIITRHIDKLPVEQRTKDGMFNATAFVKVWNEFADNTTNLGYLQKKELDKYLQNKSTQEYITTIMDRESKEKSAVYVGTRGKHGATWMHPMLFLDLAMWLNPSFKYDVIKFVQDQLIAFRNEAGDAYKALSQSVAAISTTSNIQKNMQIVGRAINFIVYNQHEHEIRNKVGEEQKMKELLDLERHIAQLINEGFIKSFSSLLQYLRESWRKKWQINPIDKLTNSRQ